MKTHVDELIDYINARLAHDEATEQRSIDATGADRKVASGWGWVADGRTSRDAIRSLVRVLTRQAVDAPSSAETALGAIAETWSERRPLADANGWPYTYTGGGLVYLTECCEATATYSDSTLCCRACFAEVDTSMNFDPKVSATDKVWQPDGEPPPAKPVQEPTTYGMVPGFDYAGFRFGDEFRVPDTFIVCGGFAYFRGPDDRLWLAPDELTLDGPGDRRTVNWNVPQNAAEFDRRMSDEVGQSKRNYAALMDQLCAAVDAARAWQGQYETPDELRTPRPAGEPVHVGGLSFGDASFDRLVRVAQQLTGARAALLPHGAPIPAGPRDSGDVQIGQVTHIGISAAYVGADGKWTGRSLFVPWESVARIHTY